MQSVISKLLAYRQQVAYQHKAAEWVLLLLFASGVLLWNRLEVMWPLFRSSLLIHMLVGLLIFPLTTGLFWWGHRTLLKRSGKAWLRMTGRLIELALIVCFLSGVYLFFGGTTGDQLSRLVNWAHWASGLILGPLVLRHGWRFSVVRIAQLKQQLGKVSDLKLTGRPVGMSPRNAFIMLVLTTLFIVTGRSYASESSSLVVSDSGTQVFSANLWQGSITRVIRDKQNNVLSKTELPLGQDIRRVAYNQKDSELVATDYLGGEVFFVDANDLEVNHRLYVGKRPFSVIYQSEFDRYWVTVFETHELVLIQDQTIQNRFKTADTPRGLALTEDGRLLVSHAMTGQVSIYDASKSISASASELPLLKRLTLAEEQHEDEFVSQGLPRLLDDIAVTPDGKEAWLPHVLWNFDHPFQFQSTVFPAVSVLDLTKGKEQEVLKQRKQLFKAINILDKNNRTRIVSNPHDLEFSATGKKAYVTLAGSDDLLVLDRTIATGLSKKKSKRRHRRKKHKVGSKAIQIYRHTAGHNPRGLIIEENRLLVQNAQEANLSLYDRGGDHRLDRISLSDAEWVALSHSEATEIGEGRLAFHSARTDEFPEYPMAGDFWMSCNSCHLDGFNFTNLYLMDAHKLSKEDKKHEARNGHFNLSAMVSGNPTKDLIQIIQDTQGGLGHDQRDGALTVNPDQPPKPVMEKMEALNAFIKLPHNLPFNSSWLRLDGQQTTHKKEWLNSAQCEECHKEMFDQWADSNHRLMGESNPYFMVAMQAAVDAEGEDFKQWCMGCHMPNNLMSNDFDFAQGHMFEKNGASLIKALEENQPDIDEGTGCLFCHRITAIEDAGGNGAFTVNLKDRETYIGEDTANGLNESVGNDVVKGVAAWLSNRQINADPDRHAKSYSQDFYKDPQLCKTCHNEFAPGTGALIVDTYGEWENSSFNDPQNPDKHRDCIDCHMHGDINRIGENIPGQSTDRGSVKENVVTHQFTGANHHLVGLRNKKLEEMSLQLMRSSATLEQKVTDNKLYVRVNNVGAGHALPTGVADFRQLWLQVTVTDAKGQVVLESGRVDDAGVVDSAARMFMKEFGDENGKPVGLLFWRYAKLLKDTRIPADGSREERFELPKGIEYPLNVSTQLMYRIYPQWVTNAVRQQYPELPEPPVVELETLRQVFNH